MDSDTLEREYRTKWTVIVSCAALFGLCAAVLGSVAASNDRGLVINGIIELGHEGATVFYWALAGLSGGFVVLAAFLAYHRITFRQRLVLDRSALTIPASRWSRQEKQIAFSRIHRLSETTVNGQRFLNVEHTGGKDTITASMLPSADAYEAVCELLAKRVRERRTSESGHATPPGPEVTSPRATLRS
jgi:hypothetical protein